MPRATSLRLSVLLVLLPAVCACGHPIGVMQPVALTAATPRTPQVDMLVATTRQPSGDP
ncbi:esterase, partial [Rhizobium ruizarguesonis]